jgi:AraC-like DNA-binding protein
MIHFHDIDMMARGGSLALLALWSWLLIRDHWSALPARVALLMNLSIVGHIIATIPGPMASNGVADWLVVYGSASVPGLFWLFARTWFGDQVRVGWPSWVLVAVPPLIFVATLFHFGRASPSFLPTGALMRALSFALAAAGLWAAWRGRDGDLVEARRQLRARLVWAVGAFVILTNATEMLVNNDRGPAVLGSVIEFGILGLTWALCAAMFGLRQRDLFGTMRPETAREAVISHDPLADKLSAFMSRERPHRDETMTIAKLAGLLGEQEYRLRRLINGQLGHRNFAAFLNGYRLDEVKEALGDATQNGVPILTIALDAGFGSLGPFNRAFREAEGMTPTAYRAAARV